MLRVPLVAAAVIGASALQASHAQTQPPADAPASETRPAWVAVTGLFPGGGSPPPEDPAAKLYQGNPQHIAEGSRLFDWYNCAGCHFHGAGGIGPAFMDPQWRYGGRLDQIFASIYQGRPNGMPSWAGKIPDAQIWEIAAYVKSLSAPSAASGNYQPTPAPPPAPPSSQSATQGAAPAAQQPSH